MTAFSAPSFETQNDQLVLIRYDECSLWNLCAKRKKSGKESRKKYGKSRPVPKFAKTLLLTFKVSGLHRPTVAPKNTKLFHWFILFCENKLHFWLQHFPNLKRARSKIKYNRFFSYLSEATGWGPLDVNDGGSKNVIPLAGWFHYSPFQSFRFYLYWYCSDRYSPMQSGARLIR